MWKLLSLICLLLICFNAHAADSSSSCRNGEIHIGVNPSTMVHVGSDAKLPLDGCFLFSIDEKGLRKPDNVGSALKQITDSMPHWMYNAILSSHGRYKCLVRVNGRGYLYILMKLYIMKWRAMGTDIDKLLADSGDSRDDPAVRLQGLLCTRIKSSSSKVRGQNSLPDTP